MLQNLAFEQKKYLEVINFIDFLKTRHAVEKFADTLVELPTDYEKAQQQALEFLDHPPFLLNGRYESRDALYDRL